MISVDRPSAAILPSLTAIASRIEERSSRVRILP